MAKKGLLNEILDTDDPFTTFADDLNSSIGSVSFIDTGSYVLNAAFSTSIYGGIPDNSVTALAGEESVGKSYLALDVLTEFLKKNERAQSILFETEGAPKQIIKTRGLDGRRIGLAQPDTIQKFSHTVMKYLNRYENLEEEEKFPLLLILDSLGGLSTTKELQDTLEGKEVKDMTRQQAIRSAFRQITLKLEKLHVPMIVTNHVYTSVGTYGSPKTIGGGGGIKYAASTIAMLSKSKIKDDDKEVVGNIIRVKMIKNRYAKEHAEVETRLFYDKGIDRYYGLSDLALKHGLFKKSTKGISLPDGTTVATKVLDNEPEKYYTKDLLNKIEEIAKKEFSYGVV